MAEEQQGTSGQEPSKAKRAASGRQEPDQLQRQAVEAYNAYMASLSEAWSATDPTGQAQQAYREYLSRIGEDWTPERMAERSAEASRIYARATQAVLDPDQDNLEAYRTYLLALAEQWQPQAMQARVQDAYAGYLDAYGAALAPDELEQRSQQAWADYIGRLKDACSQLDPSTEPAAVAALARSALAVASAAQSMRQAVKGRQAAQESVAAARPS